MLPVEALMMVLTVGEEEEEEEEEEGEEDEQELKMDWLTSIVRRGTHPVLGRLGGKARMEGSCRNRGQGKHALLGSCPS
jgi:hypothetical protein